jgi:hypothetical protein
MALVAVIFYLMLTIRSKLSSSLTMKNLIVLITLEGLWEKTVLLGLDRAFYLVKVLLEK